MTSTLGVLRSAPRGDCMLEDGSYDLDPGGAVRGLTLQKVRESNGTRRSPTRMAYFSSTAARQVLTYTNLHIFE